MWCVCAHILYYIFIGNIVLAASKQPSVLIKRRKKNKKTRERGERKKTQCTKYLLLFASRHGDEYNSILISLSLFIVVSH